MQKRDKTRPLFLFWIFEFRVYYLGFIKRDFWKKKKALQNEREEVSLE
tara:strand:+ start:1240 stop:1383 length:144 start_codon:yes stop_codon:yes gene_type:complete